LIPEEIKIRLNSGNAEYNIFILLYECETWSLALRKEHTLKAFQNRVPRRIFGPKRDEIIGWRKLRKLFYSPRMTTSRRRWTGHAAHMGTWGKEKYIYDFRGKARRKETLGSPGRRWKDNIKMDFREKEWSGVGWIVLAQDMYMYKGWAFTALAPRPTVVYCA
jgi:hypothetical protein